MCFKCNKIGYFRKVCHSPAVNVIEEGAVGNEADTFILESIGVDAIEDSKTKPYPTGSVLMSLGKEENFCDLKLDTGSQANVISENTLRSLFKPPIRLTRTKSQLIAYGGSSTECIGTVDIQCTSVASRKSAVLSFFIIKQEAGFMISNQACKALGLIEYPYETKKVNSVKTKTLPDNLKEFADVFQGIGRLTKIVS